MTLATTWHGHELIRFGGYRQIRDQIVALGLVADAGEPIDEGQSVPPGVRSSAGISRSTAASMKAASGSHVDCFS
jgi:hypothetical protein